MCVLSNSADLNVQWKYTKPAPINGRTDTKTVPASKTNVNVLATHSTLFLFNRSKGHGSGCTTSLSGMHSYLYHLYCLTPPNTVSDPKVLLDQRGHGVAVRIHNRSLKHASAEGPQLKSAAVNWLLGLRATGVLRPACNWECCSLALKVPTILPLQFLFIRRTKS